jgi:hypothetical protein
MRAKLKPKELPGIIRNVRTLSNFIDDAYLKTEDDRFGTLYSDFTLFQRQISGLYEYWFPGAKKCTDADIVNQIFLQNIDKKDQKVWVKYSIACLLNSSERVFENIKKAKKTNDTKLFQGELNLLYDMAFEAPILMQSAFKIIEGRKVRFGHGKRPYITAREVYNVSQQILTKYTYPKALGGFGLSPSSIMLLRQAIELWLQEIFGIEAATDEHSKLVKLNPAILLELLDNKGLNVKLPIPKAVIVKIHKWTQPYVHAGWMKYTWEVEHAQQILFPIFYSSKIVIKKEHYDNVQSILRTMMEQPKLKLHRAKEPLCTLK